MRSAAARRLFDHLPHGRAVSESQSEPWHTRSSSTHGGPKISWYSDCQEYSSGAAVLRPPTSAVARAAGLPCPWQRFGIDEDCFALDIASGKIRFRAKTDIHGF